MSFSRAALVACAVVASPVAAALAHVVVQPNTAVAGASVTLGLTVAHGCDGSPTIALSVRLPEGVTAARPLAKEGWTSTEVAGEIAWRDGSIDAHAHETFGLALTLPNAPGRALYFPAIQECRNGINRWIEIPAAGQNPKDLRYPAPSLTLTPQP
jgi:uncharacterized protein YcnI